MDYHKPDTAWSIEFDDESTWANASEGAGQGHTVGSTASFDLFFGTKQVPYRDPPIPEDHQERFATVLDHCKFAGKYALNVNTTTGETLFREQHTGPSLLVKITPDSGMELPSGVWGLIAGYSSDTTLPDAVCVATLDIDVIAPAAEFETHEAVRTAFEMRGP